jgi:hypothetical protein
MTLRSKLKKNEDEEIPELSIKDLFKPSKSLEVVDGLKVAIFGAPGAGKTYIGFTFPKPLYIVDIDGSSRQILETFEGRDKIYDDVNIYSVPITTEDGTNDVATVLNNIETAIKLMKKEMVDSDVKGTIIIDTASELLQWTNYWLEEQPDVKKYRATGTIMRTEYAIRDKKYADILAPLRDLKGWNILLIGHTGFKFDEKGNPTAETYPKMHQSTERFCDIMGELKRVSKGRKFVISKDRFNDMVGDVIDDPTYDSILNHFKEHAKIKVK